MTSREHESVSRDEEVIEQSLMDGFEEPPNDCRLFVRWWWFGPAVTKDELGRELEIMKSAGIGGVEIQPIYPLSPDNPGKEIRNLRHLSSEFLEAVKHVVTISSKLDLTVDMTLGSGWPYGGPHIPNSLSAGCIRYEANRVYCREGVCEPRELRVPLLRVDERILGISAIRESNGDLDPASSVDLTDHVGEDGTIKLDLEEGEWKVMFFIESHTLQEVKRPALGSEGYVLDHYHHQALEKHLETVGEPLLLAGSDKIRAAFCDSLEVYGSDWTPNFLSEFKRRRGYDLKPYLPALWNRLGGVTQQVRIDYGRTLSELAIEEFIKPLHDWCRAHRVLLRMQQYGIPPIELKGYRFVDVPEGEGRGWVQLSPSRWASSAAHLYGKRLCSAESFTFLSRILDPSIERSGFPGVRFAVSLQDLKAAADIYFIQGINHLIAHGYGYSPPSVGKPGWTLYASCLINHNNAWWRYFPLLSAYIHRVSYMLRQGDPVVDVAIYLPIHDAWARSVDPSRLEMPGSIHIQSEMLRHILSNGYNFDFINDDALISQAEVSEGSLLINGIRYSIIILPAVEFIPLRSMEKIRDFYRSGGIVIATHHLPRHTCGLVGIEKKNRDLKRVVQEIFGGEVLDEGEAYLIKEYGERFVRTLRSKLQPDIDLPKPESSIGFIHRRMGDLDIYFVANTSSKPQEVCATFRVGRKTPKLWNPFTGEICPLHTYSFEGEGTKLSTTLEPFGSVILTFSQPPKESLILETDLPKVIEVEKSTKGYLLKTRVEREGEYFIGWKKGRIDVTVRDVPPPISVKGPWNITFEMSPDEQIVMSKLRTWTKLPRYKYFSGRATYSTKFMIPREYVVDDIALQLELGEVYETAEVYVNGVRIGLSWRSPHSLEVTPFVHIGPNTLKVIVTNLLINKVLGMKEPDYTLLEGCYGQRFPLPLEYKKPFQPQPSGLLGPVQVVPLKVITTTIPSLSRETQ